MKASLSRVRAFTADEVRRLKDAGIDTTAELLKKASDTKAEQKLAEKVAIPKARMREAVNRADLMQVKGMGPVLADLFENVGVNSTKELSQRNVAKLHEVLRRYVVGHPELNYKLPSPHTVQTLVSRANRAE